MAYSDYLSKKGKRETGGVPANVNPYRNVKEKPNYTPPEYQNTVSPLPSNAFKPPVDEKTGAEKGGTEAFKWVFGKSKDAFRSITDSLAETRFFKDAGEVLNTRDKYIREGTYDAGTFDFLGEALLENVDEVSKSVSGRGVANAIDTVIASPVNFATRAIYGKSNPVGDAIAGFADEMRSSFETERSKAVANQKFGKDKLTNWDFWLLSASEQIPTTLAFMKVAQVPFMATNAGLTKLLGASKYAQIASQTIASGVSGLTMRGMESASEAEGTYKEAKRKGMSEEEALKAGSTVFSNNMKLVGLDAFQAGLAFAPGLNKIGAGSIIGKILSESVQFGLGAGSEGFEEMYQTVQQKRALGEETSWTSPETLEAGTLGFVMGALFQGAGRVREHDDKKVKEQHYNDVLGKLPPEYQAQISPDATVKEKENFLETVATQNPGVITDAINGVENDHTKRVKATKKIVETAQNTPSGSEVRAQLEQGKSKEEIALDLAQKTGTSASSAVTLVEGVISGNVPSTTSFDEIDATLAEKSALQLRKEGEAKAQKTEGEITQMKKDIAGIQKEIQKEGVSQETRTELRAQLENKRNDLKKAQEATETEAKRSAGSIRATVASLVQEAGVTENRQAIIDEVVTQVSSGKGKMTVRDIVKTVAQSKKTPEVKVEETKETKETAKTKEKKEVKNEKKKEEAKKPEKKEEKKEDEPSFTLEAIRNVNPALARKAEKAKTVDEFIDAVVKADKTTRDKVSIPDLTAFFERMKKLTAEEKKPEKKETQKEDSAFELFENEGEWKVTPTEYKGRSTANMVYSFMDKKVKKAYDAIRDRIKFGTKEEAEKLLAELQEFESLYEDLFTKAKRAIDGLEVVDDPIVIPDVVYHGTLADFTEFDEKRVGENTQWDNANFGIFFIGEEERATKFVEDTRPAGDTRPVKVKKAKITIKNPLDLTISGILTRKSQAKFLYELLWVHENVRKDITPEEALAELDGVIDLGTIGELQEGLYQDKENKKKMQDAGYDGIVSSFGQDDNGNEIYEYVVFDTKNIEMLDNAGEPTDNSGNDDDTTSGGEDNNGGTPAPIQNGSEKPRGNRKTTGTTEGEDGSGGDANGGGDTGKRPSPRLGDRLTNEEIESILNGVTASDENGVITITGEITDEIRDVANSYVPGGKSKEGRGILDEYYTNTKIVDAIKALFDFPPKGLKVLEPAIGTGNFLYALPEIGEHEVHGYEINPVTARIAKIFHPTANVYNRSFETEFVDERGNKKEFNSDYDLVIGNPPYGEHRGKYLGLGEEKGIKKYEDYFVKRSLDVLKEGGTLAMVLPGGYLERRNDTGIEGATLEVAYRLPNGVFEGTDIATDIVVLKKATGVTGKVGSYYAENRQNILGTRTKVKNRFGEFVDYFDGTIDEALELLAQARQDSEAIKILKALDMPVTPENVDVVAGTVEEAGKDGAKALTKEAKKSQTRAEKQGKKTIEKKIKTTAKKSDTVVPLSTHYAGISAKEMAIWKKTTPEGVVENPTEEEKKSLNYMRGSWYNDFYFAQGDIYEKLDKIFADKLEGNLGEARYETQKAKLEAVKPKAETVADMRITPNVDMLKKYMVARTNKFGDDIERSMANDFIEWTQNLPRNAFGNSSPWEVQAYVKNEQVRGNDKDFNDRIKSRRKRVAEDLFAKYLKELEPEEATAFEYHYNSNYNFFHVPDYTQVPLFSETYKNFGKGTFKPNNAQRRGIGRLVSTGVGVIAHEVGFGKTITGVLTAHEFMTRGWAKRPLIVAPNDSVLAQWKKTIEELVPNAKVNVLGNLGSTFKGDLSSLTIDEGSFSIVTQEGLKRISFEDATYDSLSKKFAYIADDLNAEKSKRQKQKGETTQEEVGGKMKKGTRADVYFEKLGFDHFTFDEVQDANHIVSKVKLEKGHASEFNQFSQQSSATGLKTWVASQYIQEQNNGRNVVLLSATPFTNHPLEYFSILSLVADKQLSKMGLNNVNEFFSTFMDASDEMEFKADGTYKKKTDIRRFKNMRQFRRLMDSVIDVQQEAPDIVRPNRIQKTYEIPKTPKVIELENEAQKLFTDKSQGANILMAIKELRLIAISPFLSEYSETPNSTDYKRVIEESPKLDALMRVVKQNKADNTEAGQIIYSEIGVEVFPFIKEYLDKELGYAKGEVEIITGQTSKTQRATIQEKYNKGEIKILIGSPAIGVGMNLQSNTTDMHLLSLPWNFTDLRQVVGRAWRQGNQWKNVRINQYFMEDSVDIFLSQKLDNKQNRYEAQMKSNANEVDTGGVSYNEMKFLLVKDPKTRAKLELEDAQETLALAITQEEAEVAYATRRLEKVADIQNDLTASQEALKREQEKPEPSEFWVNNYIKQVEKHQKTLTEEIAKLTERGISVETLLETKRIGDAKVAELKAKREALTTNFDARVAELTAETPSTRVYSKAVGEAFASERAEENKTFYEKKQDKVEETVSVEEVEETVVETVVEDNVEKKVEKKKKKVVARKRKTGTPSKSRDSRVMNIIMDSKLTVPEKVAEILDTKQEGKAFKDTGERVGGSKKERSAIRTIIETGNKELIEETIKTLGAEALAETLQKSEILEGAIIPDFEKDKSEGVPSSIAGWKMAVFNSISRSPVLTTKRGKWHSKMNVHTEDMNKFLTEYPERLVAFVGELANVKTYEEMEAFADKYEYNFAKYIDETGSRYTTTYGAGVVNISVLGKTIGSQIAKKRQYAYYLKEKEQAEKLLKLGVTRTNIGNGGIEKDEWATFTDWGSVRDVDSKEKAEEMFKENRDKGQEAYQKLLDNYVTNYDYFAPKKTAPKEGVDLSHGNFKPIDKYEREGSVKKERINVETLTKELGFKSVQLGNYMDDVSAKSHIEQTIASIEDASKVTGVDLPAVFNKFGLSIAFGARGGGKANAHYEPSHNIINLTKGRGDGSLWHELVHFLDEKTNQRGNRRTWSSKKDRYFVGNSIDKLTLNLMDEITGKVSMKEVTFKPQENVNIQRLEGSKIMGDYQDGVTLDVLLAETNENTSKMYYQDLADIYRKDVTAVVRVYHDETQFYKDARSLGNGAVDSYWTKPHELLARAGQAYMEDKLKEAGIKNSYLTRSTDTHPKLYPHGEERVRFNKQFDKVFAQLATEFPYKEITPRFKMREGSQTVVPGSYALPFLRDLKVRMQFDFDVRFVDTILASESAQKNKPPQEAWASVIGNTIILAKEITRWTGQHEAGHLIINNLDKMRTFTSEGITRDGLLKEQAKKMRDAGDKRFAHSFSRNEELILEEQIMLDFEEYLENKYQPEAGMIKKFFLLLKRAVIRFARTFSANPSMITDFYELIDEGIAIDGQNQDLETDGIIGAYLEEIQGGTLDYGDVEMLYGGARFKIRQEGDARLQKLKAEYNATESALTKKQEELDAHGKELAETIATNGRIAEVVEEIPESVKELAKNTTRKPPKVLTKAGESKVDLYGFANKEEAEKQIHEYVTQKTALMETRNQLGKIRKQIALLKRGNKEAKTVLRDIERKLKARKAFLENKKYYVDMGIGRGRKEQMKIIRKRGKTLNELQDMIGLSDGKANKLIGEITKKKLHLMSEREFDNFILRFVNQGTEIANNLYEQDALQALIQEKRLNKVDNLRQALKLPTIAKMNADQALMFQKVLNEYEIGDTFLTQRQLETIHRTNWGKVATEREMLERIFEDTNVSKEDLQNVSVSGDSQMFKNWLVLSRSNPLFAWLVDERFKAELQTQSELVSFEEEMNPLVKRARASREKSLGERIKNIVAPMDEIVFGYIEAEDKGKYAVDNDMTLEEVELAHWLIARLFMPAKDHMEREYQMNTRENYITHIRRGISETFVQALNDGKGVPTAVKEAVSEIFSSQKEDEVSFGILTGKTGDVVAFEKWFQFSLPRSGKLAPSKNVAKASLAYAKAYFKKRAVDAFVPEALAMAKVQEKIAGYTERGLPKSQQVTKFIHEFLNDAKGRKIWFGTTQGSSWDNALKIGIMFTAFKYLGFRPVVGLANFVGEFVGTMRATSPREKWRGLIRTIQVDKAYRVNQEYKYFTGRNPLYEIFDPQHEVQTRIKNTAMVLFSLGSYFNNRFYLRAKMTEEEWQDGLMEDEHMLTIVKEMSKWRKTPYYISSLAGGTAVASAFNQFATWAIPIVTTTASDLHQVVKKIEKDGYTEALKIEEARSLGKTFAYMGTLFAISMAIKAMDDDDDDKDVWFYIARELNTLMGAFNVVWNWEQRAPLLRQLSDMCTLIVQLLKQERYQKDGVGYGIGDLKAWNTFERVWKPTFIKSLQGEKEKVNTHADLIQEAVASGVFEPEKIAETLNPDGWNNVDGERSAEKQEEYRTNKIYELTREYNTRKEYPDSKVADIILTVDNNEKRVAEMIEYGNEVGEDKVFEELRKLKNDSSLCGNKKKKTVCLVSDELFKAYKKATK